MARRRRKISAPSTLHHSATPGAKMLHAPRCPIHANSTSRHEAAATARSARETQESGVGVRRETKLNKSRNIFLGETSSARCNAKIIALRRSRKWRRRSRTRSPSHDAMRKTVHCFPFQASRASSFRPCTVQRENHCIAAEPGPKPPIPCRGRRHSPRHDATQKTLHCVPDTPHARKARIARPHDTSYPRRRAVYGDIVHEKRGLREDD